MTSYVLLTGGLGYIGSHTAIQLIEKGFQLVIIDNLSNSSLEVLDRIYKITKIKPQFELGDLQDPIFLNHVFEKYKTSKKHNKNKASLATCFTEDLLDNKNNKAL